MAWGREPVGLIPQSKDGKLKSGTLQSAQGRASSRAGVPGISL